MSRRLQVFVSSTFLDLREERQAAVLAISEAQHIPDGMELFAAGNDSQLERIERRIDESDVYLLILGHRYGSIEPKSGKSYTRYEHDYAVEKGKPVLAMVMSDDWHDDKVKSGESKLVREHKDPTALIEFRELVKGAKYIATVNDRKELRTAVILALREVERQSDLVGWVRGDADDTRQDLKNENARLNEELANAQQQIKALEHRLANASETEVPDWETTRTALNNLKIDFLQWIPMTDQAGLSMEVRQNYQNASILSLLYFFRTPFTVGLSSLPTESIESLLFHHVAPYLTNRGLTEYVKVPASSRHERIRLSKRGNEFLVWLDQQRVKKSSPKS
jgi:nucleoside 2-deoxyribosyltransferase